MGGAWDHEERFARTEAKQATTRAPAAHGRWMHEFYLYLPIDQVIR